MAPPHNMLYFAYLCEFNPYYGVDNNIELIIPSRMIMNIYKKLLFHEKIPRLLTVPIILGRLDIVKQLLLPRHSKYIDLLTATAAKYNHFDIVVYMFNSVDTPSKFWLTLIIAARVGNISIINYLCDINVHKNINWTYPFHIINAIKNGYLNVVVRLVQDDPRFLNIDLISHAAEHGHVNIIEFLHNNGWRLHHDGHATYLAAKYGHLAAVKYLHQIGDNIHTKHNPPLSFAAERGHLNIVKYLRKNNVDIHYNNDEAIYVAIKRGKLKVVKYLYKRGCSLKAYDGDGIYNAYRRGHYLTFKYIHSKGIQFDRAAAPRFRRPLKPGHQKILDYLKEMNL